MIVRHAAAVDLAAVIACDDYAPQHPERQFRIEESLLAGDCFLAERAGNVVGYVLVKHDFFGHEFVDVLMVHPAHRRQGVGRALLQACVERCEAGLLFTSANETNDSAIRLFELVGFRRCGQIDGLNPDCAELIYRAECRDANIRS
ncbi:MAG: GNAT family N-acetyltransferase [Burkholderiales bacterium]|nr:GNAT family N-acetyltransferase [Burkholderiales bacterium]